MLISSLACFLGLRVTGGAQGVGVATTRTVVLTIVALITVDLIFTTMFYYLRMVSRRIPGFQISDLRFLNSEI